MSSMTPGVQISYYFPVMKNYLVSSSDHIAIQINFILRKTDTNHIQKVKVETLKTQTGHHRR